jgi:hypothetical protein
MVLADASASFRFSWNAPPECSTAEAIKAAVERRVQSAVFREPASRHIEASVTKQPTGWKALLTVTDASGAVLGNREVASTEPNCQTLDARVILVLALIIGPEVRKEAPAPMTPAPTPPLPLAAALPSLLPHDEMVVAMQSNRNEVRLVELRTGTLSGSVRLWHGQVEICGPPCGATVRRSAQLVITGEDVLPATVSLAETRGATATLSVRASSLRRRIWSLVALPFGFSFTALGAVALVLAPRQGPELAGLSLGSLVLGMGLVALSVIGLSEGPTVVEVRDEE